MNTIYEVEKEWTRGCRRYNFTCGQQVENWEVKSELFINSNINKAR